MNVLRIIAVVLLAVLALGFGLCGLCVSVLGGGSEAGVGLLLLLVAAGLVAGAVALWRRRRKAPLTTMAPASGRTPPDDH
jgi:hypothetical protein